MASADDIATVRRNTNEPTTDSYDDDDIGVLLTGSTIAGATAVIWREKAAKFAELVDVSESGASHKYSDLSKTALAMATHWEGVGGDDTGTSGGSSRVHVKKIVRT